MSAKRLLIAVAVDRDGRVSNHAGRAARWCVFDVWPNEVPRFIYSIELDEQASLHVWHTQHYPERHPLHAVDVAIAATAGEGVIKRLAARNVRLVTTSESDPETAVTAYLAGTLPDGLPHDEHTCGGEGHQH